MMDNEKQTLSAVRKEEAIEALDEAEAFVSEIRNYLIERTGKNIS